jgi:hypothetical protein
MKHNRSGIYEGTELERWENEGGRCCSVDEIAPLDANRKQSVTSLANGTTNATEYL